VVDVSKLEKDMDDQNLFNQRKYNISSYNW